MKYSIEGFSQAKLLEYKLDVHDAYLLRWFSDFAATGGMKQTIKCGRVYFWVHYQTVIREFPVMGINNTRSISNRFEKYVKVGLLDKEIIKTNKGTYTFFAIIDRVFRALLYNPNNSYWDKKDSENGNIALPFLQTNENASENTHTNAHTCAKVHDADIEENLQANEDTCARLELNFESNTGEKAVKNNQKSIKNAEKEDLHTNEHAGANMHTNAGSLAQRNEDTCALQYYPSTNMNPTTNYTGIVGKKELLDIKKEVLSLVEDVLSNYFSKIDIVQANEDTCATMQTNKNSFVQKSESVSDTLQTNESSCAKKDSEQFFFLKEAVGKHFDYRLFSADFWQSLYMFCESNAITQDLLESYVSFVYKKVVEKQPKSPVNYFYKVVIHPSFAAQFFEKGKDEKKALEEKERRMHECVCCLTRYNKALSVCPECSLPIEKENDLNEVAFYKAVHALPKEQQKKLEKELAEFYFSKDALKNEVIVEEIYKKYGITYKSKSHKED